MTDPQTLDAASNALVDALEASLPAWIARCVEEQFASAHGASNATAVEHSLDAAQRVREVIVPAIRELLLSDIDAQRTTPLALVRQAVPYATDALRELEVPIARRDAFSIERFPDDLYALTPGSLAELDEATAELAIIWGAAKAYEHRRRHADPG